MSDRILVSYDCSQPPLKNTVLVIQKRRLVLRNEPSPPLHSAVHACVRTNMAEQPRGSHAAATTMMTHRCHFANEETAVTWAEVSLLRGVLGHALCEQEEPLPGLELRHATSHSVRMAADMLNLALIGSFHCLAGPKCPYRA